MNRHEIPKAPETSRHARRPILVWGAGMVMILIGVILSGFEAIADDISHRTVYGIIGLLGVGIGFIVVGLIWSFRRMP